MSGKYKRSCKITVHILLYVAFILKIPETNLMTSAQRRHMLTQAVTKHCMLFSAAIYWSKGNIKFILKHLQKCHYMCDRNHT